MPTTSAATRRSSRPRAASAPTPAAEAAAQLQQNQNGVMVFAHQNTVDAMLFPQAGRTPYPEPAVARSSFITSDKQLHFNGEAIELWWHPSAHTNGDVLVYFPRSDVIVAGDLLQMGTFPMFDVEAGGRLQGLLNGAQPDHRSRRAALQPDRRHPHRAGHGYLCTESDVVEARDMATIVRDRVQYLIQKNMTLAQAKAAAAAGRLRAGVRQHHGSLDDGPLPRGRVRRPEEAVGRPGTGGEVGPQLHRRRQVMASRAMAGEASPSLCDRARPGRAAAPAAGRAGAGLGPCHGAVRSRPASGCRWSPRIGAGG